MLHVLAGHRVNQVLWRYGARNYDLRDPTHVRSGLADLAGTSFASLPPLGCCRRPTQIYAIWRGVCARTGYPKLRYHSILNEQGRICATVTSLLGNPLGRDAACLRWADGEHSVDVLWSGGSSSFEIPIKGSRLSWHFEDSGSPGKARTGGVVLEIAQHRLEFNLLGLSLTSELRGATPRIAVTHRQHPVFELFPEGKWGLNPAAYLTRWVFDKVVMVEYRGMPDEAVPRAALALVFLGALVGSVAGYLPGEPGG